jgi:Tol biopolymer transport system component/DNA-binding winged helix-turn-helix (wHTH) protein
MEHEAPNGRGVSSPSMIRFGAFELDLRAAELRKNGHRIRLQEQPFQILVELLERPGQVVSREEIRKKLWPNNTVVEFDHSINAAVKRLRDALQDSPESPQYIETLSRRGYRLIVPVSREQEKASLPEVAPLTAAPATNEEGLTRVLGDDPHEPRLIETVPTADYRFMSPVEVAERATGVSAAAPDAADGGEAGFATVSAAGNAAGRAGRIRWKWVAACAAAAGLLSGGIWYLSRPLPRPRITDYNQITHDGRSKRLGGTDGTRLYFSYISPASIAQVGVNGGETVPLPIAVPGADSQMADLSPDGSNALVRVYPADRSLWVVPMLGGTPRRVGNLEGAFSPDGASVVYSTDKGEVFVVRSDGTEPRKLATVGPFPASFKWSPNGRIIRFNRGGLLWEIASDGSGLHPLLSGWHEPGVQCCGSWTPDGHFYVFNLQSKSAGSQIWALDERRGLLRRPPSLPVPLTTGPIIWGEPRSSRDGKKIFADGRTPRGELSRIDPKTGGLQPFLGGISAEFVSYSSDGKSVAYVSFPEGVLWKADRDGSNRVQLSQSPLRVLNPRWSPDSKQILFADFREKTQEIDVIPAEGGSPQRLLPEEITRSNDPYWSPDGTRVVYTWEGLPTTELKLCILDVSSRRIETIPGSTGFFSSHWSPDGRYIAGLDRTASNLQVFDLKTQRWTTLTANGDVQFPSFSHDSRFIYFLQSGRDQGVFRISVTGGSPERVADLRDWHLTGFVGFSMSLDPTDAPLVLRDVGSDDIYALALEEK